MPAFRQRLGHGFLAELGLFPGRKRTDLHQVVPQADSIAIRLRRRQLPSRFVLSEAMFRCVSRLPDVDRSQRARLLRARTSKLDDVHRVASDIPSGHGEHSAMQSPAIAASPLSQLDVERSLDRVVKQDTIAVVAGTEVAVPKEEAVARIDIPAASSRELTGGDPAIGEFSSY
jgi:hypothetical protein